MLDTGSSGLPRNLANKRGLKSAKNYVVMCRKK